MYALDSSAIIEVIEASENLKKTATLVDDQELSTTTITLHEILVSAITDLERFKLETILDTFGILEHNTHTAKIGANIERTLIKKGTKINRADILIAAICKAYNAHLITFDKDFAKIKGLQVTVL